MALLPVHVSNTTPPTTTDWTTAKIQDTATSIVSLPSRDGFFMSDAFDTYLVYYDGSGVRLGRGNTAFMFYDRDVSLSLHETSVSPPYNKYRLTPQLGRYDSSQLSTWTITSPLHSVLRFGSVYWRDLSGGTYKLVKVSHPSTGTLIKTYNFAISGLNTSFDIDGIWFTEDKRWMYVTDKSLGLMRTWNLVTDTFGAEWSFSPAYKAVYDHMRDLFWTIRSSDTKVVVYALTPAPATFSSITMGTNRARYMSDALSVTLTGSNGEAVPNWPVEWSLSTGEGFLRDTYTLTNDAGVATNRYYGPGLDDYTGGSQTITVSTGY